MLIAHYILLGLGGITLFLLGLKFMSDSMQKIVNDKLKKIIGGLTDNRLLGVLTGTVCTAVIQSSIATDIILVGFAESGIISFFSASAVVMGANIGTTVTAQLVSLSGKDIFDITAFGSLVCFIGFLLSFSKKQKIMAVGEIMMGFGMIFLGLDIISGSVLFFKNFDEFRNFFLVKSDFLLLFNGILITAIVQSSSAVTGIMIVLAGAGLLSFESSMFLILGANIGTCFPVIIATLNKSESSRQIAVFNLLFNTLGAILFFVPLTIFKSEIASAFIGFSGSIQRTIANFHTIFNLFVTVILLPTLKPFTNFIKLIVNDTPKPKRKNKRNIQLKQKTA